MRPLTEVFHKEACMPIESSLGTMQVINSQHLSPLNTLLSSLENPHISAIRLRQGESYFSQSHSFSSIIFIYQGNATIIGGNLDKISEGQILLIPCSCYFGLKNIGAQGLQALEIQFEKKTNLSKEYTYAGLMERNEKLLQQTLKNPFFTMVKDQTLLDPNIRQRFLDNVQICSNFFQHILFIRQATCHDPLYQSIFWEHLKEEFGHDEMLAKRKVKHEVKDPILLATSSWFCHQMYTLDNVEKAALIHLTLEVGGYYYHTWAKDKLNIDVESNYYDIHSEADEEHADMARLMLQGHTQETYQKLYQIVDKGWSMVNAMTSRVAQLAN